MKIAKFNAYTRGLITGVFTIGTQFITHADVVDTRLNIGGGHTLKASLASIAAGTNNTIQTNANFSFVGGGSNNIINTNATSSAIGSGILNYLETNSSCNFIGGGSNNYVGGTNNTLGGGGSNVLSGIYGVIAGGFQHVNAAPMGYGSIGGGYGNTNYSIYGTIAGGYYNIIFDNPLDTPGYAGSSSIGGGGENTNIGAFSAIAGGSQNKIFGDFNHIGGGIQNLIMGNANSTQGMSTISGGGNNLIATNTFASVIGGGQENSEYSQGYSTIAGGTANTITANAGTAAIGGGQNNIVDNFDGTVPGGDSAKASHFGQLAYASGAFAAAGDAQTSIYVLRNSTSTSTPTILSLDGGSDPEYLTIPNNTVWTFDILIAGRSSGGNVGSFHIVGAVKNNSGTVTIPAFTKDVIYRDVSTWDTTVSINSGALSISVTGDNTSVRWVATVRAVEITY